MYSHSLHMGEIMYRRHFRAIAEALKYTQATQATCEAVALYLKTENPRFDMDKFLSACGVR